jgi:hypothetical protein
MFETDSNKDYNSKIEMEIVTPNKIIENNKENSLDIENKTKENVLQKGLYGSFEHVIKKSFSWLYYGSVKKDTNSFAEKLKESTTCEKIKDIDSKVEQNLLNNEELKTRDDEFTIIEEYISTEEYEWMKQIKDKEHDLKWAKITELEKVDHELKKKSESKLLTRNKKRKRNNVKVAFFGEEVEAIEMLRRGKLRA